MWIVQDELLVRLPDDAPLPQGSHQIEVPEDFEDHPEAYELKDKTLAKRKSAPRTGKKPALKLTQKEIAHIRKAIAERRL